MSQDTPTSDAFGRPTRVPLQTEVRLDFPQLADFVREYSADISLGGMFIKTSRPQPVGTSFRFECRLADDFKIIQGQATVMWVREKEEGPRRPAGMGVRFDELTGDSRELIFRIVDRYIQKGGEPFDLESGTAAD